MTDWQEGKWGWSDTLQSCLVCSLVRLLDRLPVHLQGEGTGLSSKCFTLCVFKVKVMMNDDGVVVFRLLGGG